MSALGRGEIIKRLRRRDLVVSPLLEDDQIGAASVDLRIGNVVLMVRARGLSHVDLSALKSAQGDTHESESRIRQKHERHEIPFQTRFLLHPGSLALVPTLEWCQLPTDLMGSVTARSTWAREGLSIATATLIEPRYNGVVTLELANLGEIPIALYPGLRIAQIAFLVVDGDTKRPKKSQFELSFEPQQGVLANALDFRFIPDPK